LATDRQNQLFAQDLEALQFLLVLVPQLVHQLVPHSALELVPQLVPHSALELVPQLVPQLVPE
jgi:hypothetical protein